MWQGQECDVFLESGGKCVKDREGTLKGRERKGGGGGKGVVTERESAQ